MRPEGLEPPTYGSEDHCSIQLSYGRWIGFPFWGKPHERQNPPAIRVKIVTVGFKGYQRRDFGYQAVFDAGSKGKILPFSRHLKSLPFLFFLALPWTYHLGILGEFYIRIEGTEIQSPPIPNRRHKCPIPSSLPTRPPRKW